MPASVGRSLHGRWAASLLRGCFGRYQNALRVILIDGASRVTAPKEAAPQGLNRLFLKSVTSLITSEAQFGDCSSLIFGCTPHPSPVPANSPPLFQY